MDNLERDKFYSEPAPADDDEYEIEPPDEAVEERRRQLIRDSLEPTIDIDEIYREADRDRGTEILEDWVRNFRLRFRFQVKHLLIITAVLAIALTLAKLQLFWTAVIVLFMLGIAALYFYLTLEEQKQQAEADRKREAMYAKRRAQLAARDTGHVVGAPVVDPEPAVPEISKSADDVKDMWQSSDAREPFRFQFSMRQLAIAMTTAAVALGLVHLLGGPVVAPTLLGFIAIIGLMVFAMGFQPPPMAVFGWWLVLVMYLLVSVVGAVWSRFE